MIKEKMYVYLGTNGTICTTVHLEDIYCIEKYRLWAEKGKALTKDYKNYVNKIIIPKEELNEWVEVDFPK